MSSYQVWWDPLDCSTLMYNQAWVKLLGGANHPKRGQTKETFQCGEFSLQPQHENYHWWTSDIHKAAGLDMTPTLEHVRGHTPKIK